jgi:hypothetical protein
MRCESTPRHERHACDPTFKRPPTLHDFPTMSDLPDLAFAATRRFGGWMFRLDS